MDIRRDTAQWAVSQGKPAASKRFWSENRILCSILLALSIALYANTFSHGFALDDQTIIFDNLDAKAPVSWENTRTIFSSTLRHGNVMDEGNNLYRPLVKWLFHLEWNAFGGDTDRQRAATGFHVVNVLLYAGCVLLIFQVFYRVKQGRWLVPFLTALLFAVHPVHTEVVANIKSGDEILGLLGVLVALRCLQLYLDKGARIWVLLAALGFTAACFSKESAVTAVAIFPVFLWFYGQTDRKRIFLLSALMLLCAMGFLGARHRVLSTVPPESGVAAIDNYMVLCDPKMQILLPANLQQKYVGTARFPSAVKTLGDYLKLFVYPHPLSCDYSYSAMEPAGYADPQFIITLLVLGLMVYVMLSRFRRREDAVFGLYWFFVTMALTSNVFFLIGTSFGERLFFVPSLGLCLVVSCLLHRALGSHGADASGPVLQVARGQVRLLVVFLCLFIPMAAKTVVRNADWESNYTLFYRDIRYFPEALHLNLYVANSLTSTEYRDQVRADLQNINAEQGQVVYTDNMIADSLDRVARRAIGYYTRVVNTLPWQMPAWSNGLGKAYFDLAEYARGRISAQAYGYLLDSAGKYYEKAFALDARSHIHWNNVGTVLYNRGSMLLEQQQQEAGTAMLLESLRYFQGAYRRDTTMVEYIRNLGCAYGSTNRLDSAIVWLNKALEKDRGDLRAMRYLEVVWARKGNQAMAEQYRMMRERAQGR